METVEQKRDDWAKNRRRIIDRIRAIAGTLDGWKIGDDIANVAGSSVGVVGGGMMLGGLLFPPLLVPGIAMSLLGVGSKVGVSLAHIESVKALAAEAQNLCEHEQDAHLLTVFLDEADELLKLRATVGAATVATNALRASTTFLRRTFITVANEAGRTSLRALLPAAAVAPIRIAAGVTAGIGMALDIVSLINGASNLAKNERDELAEKLREIANKLEEELAEATTNNDNGNNE